MKKVLNHLVLALILSLQGCAFQSAILDSENDRAGFVITKPPIQISYRGDMTPEAQQFTLDILNSIKEVPYKKYTFNTDHNVRLNRIDGKSDKVNITLNESTSKQGGDNEKDSN